MILSWNVTRECNLRCRHCYRDAGAKDPSELDRREAVLLIGEIALAGFKILILSGGEPLLRDDIYELVSHARRAGLRPVLGTNGVLLDDRAAVSLKEAGLARAGISLDSVDAETHDRFRRSRGAWKKSVAAMESCRRAGLEFQMHTTVAGHNREELEKLTDFAVRRGAKAHHIFFLVPSGRGSAMRDSLIAPEEYEPLLKRILEKQQDTGIELKPVCAPQFMRLSEEMGIGTRFQRGCLAGTDYCCILPNGDVHPCPYLPLKVGNVRSEPFSRIWEMGSVFKRLRSLDYSGTCASCGYEKTCGGCRARAFASTGDYMAADYYCGLNRQAVSRGNVPV